MKNKYKLSKAGMDTLMEKLAQVAQEQGDASGLHEAAISSKFLNMIVKVNGLEDVITRNDQLTKTFRGYLDMYGFETMYDMYIYAKSCDLFPEEIFKNRSSNLVVVPVQKTIIRNGKPLEVTVYETLTKADSKPKEKPKKEEEQTVKHARELHGILHGKDDVANTKNVAKLKDAAEKMTNGSGSFSDKSDHYLSLKDNGRVAAVIGYSEKGEYYKMDFYRTNGKVSGVAARGFFELLRLALQHQKGVMAKDSQGARSVYIQAGLQKDGSNWVVTYEELKEAYGESGSDSD